MKAGTATKMVLNMLSTGVMIRMGAVSAAYAAGEPIRLTMTKSRWSGDMPEAILSGGRMGWPAILSSLKSLLETGKPLAIEMKRRAL